MKLWNICAGRERQPQLMLMTGLLIILRNALANFARRDPDDGVEGRIIVGALAEDLNPNGALLQQFPLAIQSRVNDVAEEGGETAAMAEVGAGEQPFQLRREREPFLFCVSLGYSRGVGSNCHNRR